MRKVLLTLAFAASAFAAATVTSRADDCDYGYDNSGYYASGYSAGYSSYRVAHTYTATTYYDCRTVTYRVWDDYSGTYIVRTRTVCN